MTSKALLFLGLMVVFLVASEVAARDLTKEYKKNEVEEVKQTDQYGGNPGGGYPRGYGGNPGGGYPRGYGGNPGGGYPIGYGGNPGGGYPIGYGGNPGRGSGGYGGRYCSYGCCYRGYGGCSRCCAYAGEAVQTEPAH